jgi:hypothetical protein
MTGRAGFRVDYAMTCEVPAYTASKEGFELLAMKVGATSDCAKIVGIFGGLASACIICTILKRWSGAE